MTSQKDCVVEKPQTPNLLRIRQNVILKGSTLVLPFIFLCIPVFANHTKESLRFSPLHLEAQKALYRFESPRVRVLLKKESSSPVSVYLLEMTRIFEEMLGCVSYSGKSVETAIEQLKKAPEHPNKGLLMADLYVYSAFNAAYNNENLTASAALYKAWNVLRAHQKEYPEEGFNIKFFCLFGGLSHAAPDRFQWLVQQSGLRILPNQAIQKLDLLAKKPISRPEQKAWQFESAIFTAFLTHYALKQPDKAYARVDVLLGALPDNPMHCFLLNAFALQTAHSKHIQSKPQEKFFEQLPYLAYQNAMAKLHALDSAAFMYFHRFLSLQNGGHLVKSAWHKLSWLAVLFKTPAEYKRYCKNCLAEGKTIREEDRYALRQCKEAEIPHPTLLKLRLLYDGGRMSEAFELARNLHHEHFQTVAEKTEYLYRKGRISEAVGLQETAIRFYKACAETGAKQASYYACKSCLLIAAHYKASGNCKEASVWYSKASRNKYVKEYRSTLMEEAIKGLESCP